MRVHILASGSTGNAVFIEMGQTRLLIDAGISCRRIGMGLNAIGVGLDELSAVLITHEHNDHIKGLEVLARRYGIPIWARPATWEAIPFSDRIPASQCHPLTGDLTIGGIDVHPFPISHDASDPVGFSFEYNNKKCVLATDLGTVTEQVRHNLMEADIMILEANHDPTLLAAGPYPYYLKKRIAGRLGHLSNHDCARLLASIKPQSGAQVFLAHLSQQNNTPALAQKTVTDYLKSQGCEVGRELVLHLTYPDSPVGLVV